MHYIDEIMLIELNDQEVATTFNSLATHRHIRGWEINTIKIQAPSSTVKFLQVQWCGAFRDISSNMKDELLHQVPPITKKEAQYLMGLFRFWIQHIPHLGCYSR